MGSDGAGAKPKFRGKLGWMPFVSEGQKRFFFRALSGHGGESGNLRRGPAAPQLQEPSEPSSGLSFPCDANRGFLKKAWVS